MKKTLFALAIFTSAISSYGFEREYVKRAMLSKEQEKVVLALAEKRGLNKIAKIYTYNMYPSAARGIGVKEVEEVKGREVSFRVLNVTYKNWFHPGSAPRKGDLQMGDFWAGKPSTRKQTILKVDKKEYRTGSVQGLSIEECESILSLLLAKKFSLGAGINERSFNQIDWNNPQGFRKRGDAISVSFSHQAEAGGFFDLQLKLDKKQLTITQMFEAIP
ncbi:MAG: hypothetical protein VB835_04810 [Pirellulales bacterium]